MLTSWELVKIKKKKKRHKFKIKLVPKPFSPAEILAFLKLGVRSYLKTKAQKTPLN